ncbi:hypothetical protein B0O99DRAFT_639824, partial [Bisporella sp. PMI_857]
MADAEAKSRACDECRRLHRKCDLVKPQCSPCKRSGRKCHHTQLKFHFKQPFPLGNDFPRPKAWTSSPVSIRFLDETAETIRDYHIETGQQLTAETEPDSGSASPSSPALLFPSVALRGPATWGRHNQARPIDYWPLKNSTESLLFKHFAHNISPCFFDFCDRERHFALDVPERARTCSPLLHAIFALSARHLSHTREDFDPQIADEYYQRCLETLIPELNRTGADLNDNLLAATVILRLLEELNVPLAGIDLCQHSVGTRAFLRSQTAQPPCTGLRRAASWAGVRQEIYVSLSLYRPPAIKASSDMLDSLDPSDDSTWASLAVSHCSDVLEYCFTESPPKVEVYDSLLADNQRWNTERPPSYDPLYVYKSKDPNHNSFWEFTLQADWHVMGWQYMALAQLLLTIHNPHIVKMPQGQHVTWKRMNEQARNAVRLLCSIAQSNPSTPPGILVACMGAKVCGKLFEDTGEQRALLEILLRAEEIHGWPTKDVRVNLCKVWAENTQDKVIGPEL